MTKEITYTFEGLIFSIEFLVGHPMQITHKGKHWAKTTQCVVKRNGLVIGLGSVTKHENDKDNPKYARMYATKKAFANAEYKIWSPVRKALWEQILAD